MSVFPVELLLHENKTFAHDCLSVPRTFLRTQNVLNERRLTRSR